MTIMGKLSLGEKYALKVFHDTAVNVPAYRDFLKKHKVRHLSIKKIRDFEKLPITSKEDYIDKYPLESLVRKGSLADQKIINTSSGTTGKPYYWPNDPQDITRGADIHELIFRESFRIQNQKTLIIICFGMGTWIAGNFTFLTSYFIAKKNYKITIMTPGFNKKESIEIIKRISPKYDQTIIAGIPTFIKDLLDECKDKKILKQNKIKLLFAGEAFPESWRDHIMNILPGSNYYADSVSILGSADASLMGFETPFSILIRKLAALDNELNNILFESDRIPTLVNYFPDHRYFEAQQGELLVTLERSIPLIRYNIHDSGGILSHDELNSRLSKAGYTAGQYIRKYHISKPIQLPFVYIFGRGKFSATLYGVNIYAENVKEVLLQRSIRNLVTGRVKMATSFDQNHNQFLDLKIELSKKGKNDPKLTKKLADLFVHVVSQLNKEYNRMYEEYGNKARPKITLYEYNNKEFFDNEKPIKTA